jgi:DNA helicase-2/ATP-dependent DNA helicase PcrA
MTPAELTENLTDPQRAAVMHTEGPLLVLAGAGSGKTRVITRRAAYIAATVARPDQVLAITFTNKAAGEMRERIIGLGAARSRGSGDMWVCTFHSLCARLLRIYGEAVKLPENFTILDESDRRTVLREAIETCALRTENWQPRMLEKLISDAKNDCIAPQQYESDAFDVTTRTAARVYRIYQESLQRQNACDFDDLLMYTALLLKVESIRAILSDRFRYLLIDEYQDTNHAQYLIASRLAAAHHNICATGDPDQSIYAWRGANIQNILDFESEYPNATVIRLEQNFRSVGSILAVASQLIQNNERRKHKDLWTDQEMGPSVRIWSCEDERHEAAKIAEDIAWHLQEGRGGADIAIFYRVNAMTRALEDALRSAKIPYQIARGVEFYARKEIKDVLCYLRTIINPADETAVLRAINTPARGIGKTTIEKIKLRAIQSRITIDEALNHLVAEVRSGKSSRASRY